MGFFRELDDGVVLEALPVSMLWLCHADETGGVFSGVFCDCGEDPIQCSVQSGGRVMVEGFE
jgi:hypothetical protein